MQRFSLFLLLAVLGLQVRASDTACATTPTAISTFGAGPSNGCYIVDLGFNNFIVSGNNGGNPAPLIPGSSQIDAADALGNGSSTSQELALTAPTTGSSCGSGTTLWCVNGGGYTYANGSATYYQPAYQESITSFSATINQSAASPPPGPGEYYGFSTLALGYVTPTNTGGYYTTTYLCGNSTCSAAWYSLVFLEEFYCVNVSSSAGCATSNEGEIYYETYNTPTGTEYSSAAYEPGFTISSCGNCVTFGSGVTQIFIEDYVETEWVESGTVSYSGPLYNLFEEDLTTPEPSTFFYFLPALALIYFRRNKTTKENQ